VASARGAVALAFILLIAESGRTATVSVAGQDGAPGANGLDSPPAPQATNGEPGEAGGDAKAVAGGNSDASNDATATGGNGGPGGLAGQSASPPFAAAGVGGNGGAADARADTSIHSGSAVAASLASGGSGAPGGAGGFANAQSNALNDGGTASAGATALGGAGSPGSSIGGGADARAIATGLGDAAATAHAVGGTSDSPQSGGFVSEASAWATSDSGNAIATVEAVGGANPSGFGGVGIVNANASAPHGDATVIARSIGGAGRYGGEANFSFGIVYGSASGRLTLIQEAIGGDTSEPVEASPSSYSLSADSEVHAQNSGGGPLTVYSTARGAYGGVAQAIADGGGPFGVPYDLHAIAIASPASHVAPCAPGLECGVILDPGFGAIAEGSVGGTSTTDLLATALSTGTNSVNQFASSLVRLADGDVSTFRNWVQLGAPAYTGSIVSSPADAALSLDLQMAANESAKRVDVGTLVRGAEARSFLQVSSADVATWTAGNPNTSKVIADGARVLALSSAGFASDAPGVLTYSGAAELTFAASGSEPQGVLLAFLDPTVIGGIDGLHLRVERDGSPTVFDETFSGPAEIAGLDDRVVPLEQAFLPGVSTTLTLLFDVAFAPGATDPGKLGLDLAFLARVPEPSAALLALAGALPFLLTRRRA